MKTRTQSVHPGSFLAGILIGITALLVLVAALPGSQPRASSPAGQNGIVRGLDQSGFQLKAAWINVMDKVKSFSISRSIRSACLPFRSWYNAQDEKFVAFLALHGVHLARWLLPLTLCE